MNYGKYTITNTQNLIYTGKNDNATVTIGDRKMLVKKVASMNGAAFVVQSNAATHGLEWAAKKHQEQCKKQGKPSNFDVFYFALFGRYPTR